MQIDFYFVVAWILTAKTPAELPESKEVKSHWGFPKSPGGPLGVVSDSGEGAQESCKNDSPPSESLGLDLTVL